MLRLKAIMVEMCPHYFKSQNNSLGYFRMKLDQISILKAATLGLK